MNIDNSDEFILHKINYLENIIDDEAHSTTYETSETIFQFDPEGDTSHDGQEIFYQMINLLKEEVGNFKGILETKQCSSHPEDISYKIYSAVDLKVISKTLEVIEQAKNFEQLGPYIDLFEEFQPTQLDWSLVENDFIYRFYDRLNGLLYTVVNDNNITKALDKLNTASNLYNCSSNDLKLESPLMSLNSDSRDQCNYVAKVGEPCDKERFINTLKEICIIRPDWAEKEKNFQYHSSRMNESTDFDLLNYEVIFHILNEIEANWGENTITTVLKDLELLRKIKEPDYYKSSDIVLGEFFDKDSPDSGQLRAQGNRVLKSKMSKMDVITRQAYLEESRKCPRITGVFYATKCRSWVAQTPKRNERKKQVYFPIKDGFYRARHSAIAERLNHLAENNCKELKQKKTKNKASEDWRKEVLPIMISSARNKKRKLTNDEYEDVQDHTCSFSTKKNIYQALQIPISSFQSNEQKSVL